MAMRMPRVAGLRARPLLLGPLLAACWALCAAQGSAERVVKVALTAPDAVLIRAGSFAMGSDDADVAFAVDLCRAHEQQPERCVAAAFADEQPRHEVHLRAYRIDRTEVSRRDYLRCVERGACDPPRISDLDARFAKPEHPITGVRAVEAQAYCESMGGRLPTEAQWERAARGSGARRFPWGTDWNPRLANHGEATSGAAPRDGFEHAAPVDAFADGASAYGLLNMAGNAWELSADRYAQDAYARCSRYDPEGPAEGAFRVIRGGGSSSAPHALRVTARASLKEQEARGDVGFRCAYDVLREVLPRPLRVAPQPTDDRAKKDRPAR